MLKIPIEDLQSSQVRSTIIEQLKLGAIIAYPTDTVVGIGCIGTRQFVVEKLFHSKQRDSSQPVSFAFSSLQMVEKYAQIPPNAQKLLSLLPGPITLILPTSRTSEKLYGLSGDSIGIRIFDLPVLSMLIEELGEPIITTSANISGQAVASSSAELDEELLSWLDVLITSVKTFDGEPSTVVSCIDDIKILREGAITSKTIFDLLSS